MRYLRLFAALLFLISCFSLAGCAKDWSVVFDDIYDVQDWYYEPFGVDSTKSISSNGWLLDGYRATLKKLFTGDCTMTVVFELLCGNSMQVETLGFYFTGYPGNQVLGLYISNLGDDADEQYDLIDNTSAYNTHVNVPGLRRIGTNTLKFRKTAHSVRITMNGSLVLSRDFDNYSEGYVVPKLEAYIYQGMGKVLFKSMTISYGGEMVDI